jgi:hypothetical protein
LALRISDFPALLDPGLHALDTNGLWRLGVSGFPLSKRRQKIFAGFMEIACKLVEYGVQGDLIVDGSFLTQEIEPSDIDFTLCVSEHFYLGSSGMQRSYLDWISDDQSIKQTHLCDCALCVDCAPGSKMYFDGIQNRKYWTDLYRYSKVVKRERGIAVIHLTGSLL